MLPIDPRPSRADPEARRIRKEMEKEHNYEWIPPIVLGLLGVTLAWDVTKDVAKCEERKIKDKEGGEDNKKESGEDEARRRRRRGDRDTRRSTTRRHGGDKDDEDRGRGRGRAAAAADDSADEDDGYDEYDQRRRVRGRTTDGGLDRLDRLERGEGDGGRDRDEYRRRRSLAYDNYYDQARPSRGRDYGDSDYEYAGSTRGRTYDDRRGRPRPRRRSSDW